MEAYVTISAASLKLNPLKLQSTSVAELLIVLEKGKPVTHSFQYWNFNFFSEVNSFI